MLLLDSQGQERSDYRVSGRADLRGDTSSLTKSAQLEVAARASQSKSKRGLPAIRPVPKSLLLMALVTGVLLLSPVRSHAQMWAPLPGCIDFYVAVFP